MTLQPEVSLLQTVVRGVMHDRKAAFRVKLRGINELCASKGVIGGGHIDIVFNACVTEAEDRFRLIVATTKQNVMDTTYSLEPNAILAVFDGCLPVDADLLEGMRAALLVSARGAAEGYVSGLISEIETKQNRHRAELEFFASSPRRANTEGISIQGDAAYVQAGGVSNVSQVISNTDETNRHNGALAQVRGLLGLVEGCANEAVAKDSSLTKADADLFEQVFTVAYGVDVSTAASALAIDLATLYQCLHDIQAQCRELAAIHDEFLEFRALEERGHFYQTGSEKREKFVNRRGVAVTAIHQAIAAARLVLGDE